MLSREAARETHSENLCRDDAFGDACGKESRGGDTATRLRLAEAHVAVRGDQPASAHTSQLGSLRTRQADSDMDNTRDIWGSAC
eukprot:3697940-Rhodomonas_salina.1